MKEPAKNEAKSKFRMRLYKGAYSDNSELYETGARASLVICDRWTRAITKGMRLKNGDVVDVSITVREVKPLAKKVK